MTGRDASDGDADADAAGSGHTDGTGVPADDTDTPAEVDPDDPTERAVELGCQLLARLEHEELSVADALDRIEAVTTEPSLQRRILDEAEVRGLVERDGPTVRPSGGTFLRFESEVVTKDGDFDCQRCGASLSTGYFMRLDGGDVGPYGSTCIRKVTGRE